MDKILIRRLIRQALEEDLGQLGDITTDSIFSGEEYSEANLMMKSNGTIAGLDIACMVFEEIDPMVEMLKYYNDGDYVKKGKSILRLRGKTSSLLKGERLALNYLQRMSGIATQTAKLVKKISDYKTKLVDTRKTTPNFRVFEKFAVKCGGGFNHRYGLYDTVLIKDNHIAAAGGLKEAVKRVRDKLGHTIKIEVEVQDEEKLKEAIKLKVDIIMLDNFKPKELKPLIKSVPKGIITECSGNINSRNIVDYAKQGPDIISMGSLTHSYKSLDISMDITTE